MTSTGVPQNYPQDRPCPEPLSEQGRAGATDRILGSKYTIIYMGPVLRLLQWPRQPDREPQGYLDQ